MKRPQLTDDRGVIAKGPKPWTHIKRPKLRERGTGGVAYRRWQGGGQAGGSGVHAPTLHRQKPQLGGDGSGAQRGCLADGVKSQGLREYMEALAARLRYVRVCCGDWRRVLTPSVTTYIGVTGVFLDPPYRVSLKCGKRNRTSHIYASDRNQDINALCDEVQAWCLRWGTNKQVRIALCGLEGEYPEIEAAGWEVHAWKSNGGYGNRSAARGENDNADRERVWFSPHCVKLEGWLFG